MKTDQPAKEFESIADAARRLLAELDERKKRPAVERTAEIQIGVTVPTSRRGGSREAAKNALELPPPVAPVRLGGAGLGCRGFYGKTLRINPAANDADDDWLW